MYYDPVKDIFAAIIKKYPVLRIAFYKLLDLMFLRSWYVRRELRNLRKLFSNKNIAILDAGTGYAQYSYFMSKNLQPNSIKAIDVKDKWINDAQEFFKSINSNNISFGVEDLTQINYKEQFDLIICVDVMEHIEADVIVFKNFYNALKKDGYLLINSPSIFGGSDVHDEEGESFISEHARDGYSKEDLKEKLEPLGFSIFSSKYTYGFWGDKAWRLGIKYPLLMLNVSKLFFIILPFYYLITFPFTLFMMFMDYSTENNVGSGINLIAKKI